ncbi:MAG: hypothetical protein ACI8PT_004345 [Gammaproteobacteria bacterium]|jgi:hypothetical protein
MPDTMPDTMPDMMPDMMLLIEARELRLRALGGVGSRAFGRRRIPFTLRSCYVHVPAANQSLVRFVR